MRLRDTDQSDSASNFISSCFVLLVIQNTLISGERCNDPRGLVTKDLRKFCNGIQPLAGWRMKSLLMTEGELSVLETAPEIRINGIHATPINL